MLYIEAVMYDSNEDQLFIAQLPVNTINLTFFDHNDIKTIKFNSEIENTNQGIYLLGSL